MPDKPNIILITAWKLEAQPLIIKLNLKKESESPFLIYRRKSIALVITEVAALNCAAAVGYVSGLYGLNSNCLFLNIGVCGHEHLTIGTAILGHKISNSKNGKPFYPSVIFQKDFMTQEVISYSRPVKNYPPNACVDMEAYAFSATASKFTSIDLVHTIKIVSDNKNYPIDILDKSTIPLLIADNIPIIKTFLAYYEKILNNEELENITEFIPECFANVHFSYAEKRILKEKMKQLKILSAKEGNQILGFEGIKSAKDALKLISEQIKALQP